MFTLSRRSLSLASALLAVAVPLGASVGVPVPHVTARPSLAFAGFSGPHPGGPVTQIGPWGGYIATGETGTFTRASASWRISKVSCSGQRWFSPWVGIDGYTNGVVEQTGAATICSGSTATYQAWYEMFPAPIVWYDDPISLGDRIEASVTVSANSLTPRLFTLTISDVTKGWTERVGKVTGMEQLSSAEAVIEGPGFYPGITAQPFTDVRFNGRPLGSFDPVKSDTQNADGGPIYSATRIRRGTDFVMKPISSR